MGCSPGSLSGGLSVNGDQTWLLEEAPGSSSIAAPPKQQPLEDLQWRARALQSVTRDGCALQHVGEKFTRDPEIVLTAVRQNGAALQYAANSCKQDRNIVLTAVADCCAEALQYAPEDFTCDREIVLTSVKFRASTLRYAAEACKGDRVIVLAGVNQDACVLQHAAESCKNDDEIVRVALEKDAQALRYVGEDFKKDRKVVLAAVARNGCVLEHAAEDCRRDRGIVLAAMQQSLRALEFAAEELLVDSTFAAADKEKCIILKVRMLSGRYVHLVFPVDHSNCACEVIARCCDRLGITRVGGERLVQGTVIMPTTGKLSEWTGVHAGGEVNEFLLIVGVEPPGDVA